MVCPEVISAEVRASPRGGDARERRLFARWQQFHDEGARDQLVSRYLPLARSLARRFHPRHEAAEDLEQVASIGLLKAVDRFEAERGYAFTSFATPTILGELKRYKRDYGWTLHVPRTVREESVRVAQVARRLEGELGRCPRISELCAASGLSSEQVLGALEAESAAAPGSLDATVRAEDQNFAHRNAVGVDDDGYELVELLDRVGRRLRACTDRERLMLRLRLVEGRTQKEIAKQVGLSQMQVSRVLRRLVAEATGAE